MFGKISRRKSDALFSLYIRKKTRWQCERCKKQLGENTKNLHCSHFWGRRNEATRFSEENCSALCIGCHRFFTENPEEHRQWMLHKLGKDRFKKLMILSNTTRKRDDKMATLYWKERLKELDD